MRNGLKWMMNLMTFISACALPLSAHALLATCTVAVTGIAFPVYVAYPGAGNSDGTGDVAVTCSGLGVLVSYTMELGTGSGTFATRTLIYAVSNSLNYNLFTDTGRTIIWGDGSAGAGANTMTDGYVLSLGPTTRHYTVYGRVPGAQNKPAGNYTDAVIVTITY
ncbi:Spore Coat Protein U domain-containing protein [Collimonas sp. OK307]|uniref:Csu type fimbrial protein n=1 Tax=Collimonas sp. OK307 TaxID=1801620 RepID=UPI0008EA7F57|nr:spore coat U domain-containing protein [Collimonas sp. OK307]SFH64834.1 Spore Coat Protein U domain-containing protein [Collimonas sp. OK307]